MGKIKVLSDHLCNQITAGEVVERPAAVVKELVENSVDAGALRIRVYLQKGGRSLVRVVDDGEGMSPEDALLALERHATSKIATAEDLQAIRSMGFRGEALPSIAAVSRLEMVTREKEAVCGTRIVVEGGTIRSVEEVGCPAGTSITVRDLFYNVPARRKFLRTVETETAHISDMFLRLALAQSDLYWQLVHHDRTVHDFPKAASLHDRVYHVFGAALAKSLIPVDFQSEHAAVRGLIGPPELQRANARSLFLFVNKRPVKDNLLTHAVLTAYDTLLPKGAYPFAVLFVDVPPRLVDVNVHPTKREVRFRDPPLVLDVVRRALAQGLESAMKASWSRPFYASLESSRPTAAAAGAAEGRAGLGAVPPWTAPGSGAQRETIPIPWMTRLPDGSPAWDPSREERPLEAGAPPAFSSLRILGQLACAYILVEAPDGLILIDQHAAHERISYERLRAGSESAGSQRLAPPVVLDLPPLEADALGRWLPQLQSLGFDIEPFGGGSFVIHAMPAALKQADPADLIRRLAESTPAEERRPRVDLLEKLAHTAACHGSVRAGQRLNMEEMRQLLKDLDAARLSATCPHGRPLWWKITLDQIQRFFQRT
ncbi:MAG: DNA mismatch repair endonuclease MutL [Desulfosoma sp.]